MNLIVAYKRIAYRLIEEANLSILNFHMGAKVRNQYQSNNVINIHSFQELIIVVNVLMKIFVVFEIKWCIWWLVEAFLINLWFRFGVIASGLVFTLVSYFQSNSTKFFFRKLFIQYKKYLVSDIIVFSFVVIVVGTDFWVIFRVFFDSVMHSLNFQHFI